MDGLGTRFRGRKIGDGVQAALGEGMTAGKAAEGKPGATDDSETRERNVGILRAGGEIEALREAEDMQRG